MLGESVAPSLGRIGSGDHYLAGILERRGEGVRLGDVTLADADAERLHIGRLARAADTGCHLV